jgi:hypothetical protein
MDAALLRELQDRDRFFSERFAGAAAAEEWKRIRESGEQEHATRAQRDRGIQREEEDALGSWPAGKRSSLLDVLLTVDGNSSQVAQA